MVQHEKVTFYDNSFLAVFLQTQGSVWPKVLPFGLLNVALTWVVYWLRDGGVVDLTFTSQGHTFMSALVTFGIVARSNKVYERYTLYRTHLENSLRSGREIVQHACVITACRRNDEQAALWRADVAKRTISIIRVSMKVLDNISEREGHTDIFENETRDVIDDAKSYLEHRLNSGYTEHNNDNRLRYHNLLVHGLRRAILSQRMIFGDDEKMHVNEEMKLLQFTDEMIQTWYSLIGLITTPYPYRLVEMGRTFLYFWVYSLPFVLSIVEHEEWQTMLLMFVVTYGYMGIEFVSYELDDPFGSDPNDFDNAYLARIAIDDILNFVYKTDGKVYGDMVKEHALIDSKTETWIYSYHSSSSASVDSWRAFS